MTDSTADIRTQAADWVVRLAGAGEAASAEVRAACDAWRAEDARHDRIFREIEQLWNAVAPGRARRRRRAVAGGTLAVLLLASAALLPFSHWLTAPPAVIERTAVGEIRRVPLADGSTLTLDTHSAVKIQFGERERRVTLLEGEVQAEVAKDAGRPFVIQGRDGWARARGTRYLVRQDERDTTVTVLESKVEVSSRAHPERAVLVAAGQRIRFDAERIDSPAPAEGGADGWISARLVFHDAPLGDVVAELGRYRTERIRIADDALRSLRFTGVLPVDKGDAALALLAGALPLQVARNGTDVLELHADPASRRH